MKKNLLIGNGINIAHTDLFSLDNIRDRFYETLLKDNFNENEQEIKKYILQWVKLKQKLKLNIEEVSNDAYEYVKTHIEKEKGVFNSNNNQRLVRIIKRNALNAIFIKNNKFINISITEDIKEKIEYFENIFTLNYYEYWDEMGKAQYLHGKIELLKNADELIDISKCVFSPKLHEDKCDVETLYPSNILYPSEDLTPGNSKKLYEELKGLDELSIFGVSPYGDTQLLDCITPIKQKRIFVHKMEEDDIKEWEKHVGKSKFLNSSEFTNERSNYA